MEPFDGKVKYILALYTLERGLNLHGGESWPHWPLGYPTRMLVDCVLQLKAASSSNINVHLFSSLERFETSKLLALSSIYDWPHLDSSPHLFDTKDKVFGNYCEARLFNSERQARE